MAQEWSAQIPGDVEDLDLQLDLAFSNIDDNAPDGLTGDTTVRIELRLE